ncbi:MAG: cytochrome c peroxidase [Methylophagaceae bacterium]|jgi:cytochrome c peroxidase
MQQIHVQFKRAMVSNPTLINVAEVPPLGLPPIPVSIANPITEGKSALGRKLFFDRRLSINNTFSCAIFHIPGQGFTNHEIERTVGVERHSHRRNSPTIFNTTYLARLPHDGRENSLGTPVWSPLLAHNEMTMPSMGRVFERINGLADYKGLFEQAFDGQSVNPVTMGQALATYSRVLDSGNSPFDRWH